MALYLQPVGEGVAQLVTTLQTSLPVRVRIPAIPKRPWLRGRGPSPRARWFQWKICRGPLDEQKIPRGGARAVQPGMPFPNLYRCNKVLVNQKKIGDIQVTECMCYQVGTMWKHGKGAHWKAGGINLSNDVPAGQVQFPTCPGHKLNLYQEVVDHPTLILCWVCTAEI